MKKAYVGIEIKVDVKGVAPEGFGAQLAKNVQQAVLQTKEQFGLRADDESPEGAATYTADELVNTRTGERLRPARDYTLGDVRDALIGERPAAQDTVQVFLNDVCVVAEGLAVPRTMLYNAYRTYCATQGLDPLDARGFTIIMTAKGYHHALGRTPTKVERLYTGVKLKEQSEAQPRSIREVLREERARLSPQEQAEYQRAEDSVLTLTARNLGVSREHFEQMLESDELPAEFRTPEGLERLLKGIMNTGLQFAVYEAFNKRGR